MNDNIEIPIESLENWILKKPFWEQNVWKINLEKEYLTIEDINLCYKYLSEHLDLIDSTNQKPQTLSFKNNFYSDNEITVNNSDTNSLKKEILEIKNFSNVNAISDSCKIELNSKLTLVYGENGSGKSSISRLLCNACFSRGEREILPNLKIESSFTTEAKATFIIKDSSGLTEDIEYTLGDNIDDLKCFSVFDSKSVLIHLDESNSVNFTPAQIKIFDQVAETISKLEEKLLNEKNVRKKDDPFTNMFLTDDKTSDISLFCKNINANTEIDDFLKYANFNAVTDEQKILDLIKDIDEKKKLDITRKKANLVSDRKYLTDLKSKLHSTINHFSEENKSLINKLNSDIFEKTEIVKSLSVQKFNVEFIKTIGSPEWKALISTAKILYDNEKKINDNIDIEYCILCHQKLSTNSKNLFSKYWSFLESKAEFELADLISKQNNILEILKSTKNSYPKFSDTDAGINILNEENPDYLINLKTQFSELFIILEDWIYNVEKSEKVSNERVPKIDLEKITELIENKTTEELSLIDPSKEIAKLSTELNYLKHKKDVTIIKDKALVYISFLKWSSKANKANFSNVRKNNTIKRKELFLIHVGSSYVQVYNKVLKSLGFDFNLTLHTRGEQGNTVKEYRLDFAKDHKLSQILSEGEQNVCSLADFLTEVQLNNKNYGIIFDDPVSSLDHERKDKIAERLTKEAEQRQVLIFTHDLVFMSKLVKYANELTIPFTASWIKNVKGNPGIIENNSSPKLATLSNLKSKATNALKNFNDLDFSKQEDQLGLAFDYLRSACEALIEEDLFAGTIKRYEDHIKVQNLNEVKFDLNLALKIVKLHGDLSGFIPGHNRSDSKRENLPKLSDFDNYLKEFDNIEKELNSLSKTANNERTKRKEEEKKKHAGW